ncbi:AAA family ATPase [Ignatzschineria sp. LJL83]
MRKEDFFRELPWLKLGPTEEVMRKIKQHIFSHRGDFYAIYGPAGCGKTRFMQELKARLDSDDFVVAHEVVAGNKTVYQQVAKILDTSEDEADIIARLEEIPPTGLKMVLLVDDADGLTNEELSFLYRLKEHVNKKYRSRHLVIALFMDLNNQDIFSKELLLKSNSFTIGPINLIQVKEFVNHLYQAHGKESPYSMVELKRLHAFSYGYPGRVARLVAPDLESRFEFKLKYLLLGIVLLGVISTAIWSAFHYQDILEYFDSDETEQTEGLPIPPANEEPITTSDIVEDAGINPYQGIIIMQEGDSTFNPDALLDDVIDEILDEVEAPKN